MAQANEASDAHKVFVKAAAKSSTSSGVPMAVPCSAASDQPAEYLDLAFAGCPVSAVDGASASSCPVASDAQHAARINMDVVPNTASTSGAQLDTSRQRSSIPIAAESLPQHQKGAESEVWMYPSQQQFYNAMKRKVGLMRSGQRRSTHWLTLYSCTAQAGNATASAHHLL